MVGVLLLEVAPRWPTKRPLICPSLPLLHCPRSDTVDGTGCYQNVLLVPSRVGLGLGNVAVTLWPCESDRIEPGAGSLRLDSGQPWKELVEGTILAIFFTCSRLFHPTFVVHPQVTVCFVGPPIRRHCFLPTLPPTTYLRYHLPTYHNSPTRLSLSLNPCSTPNHQSPTPGARFLPVSAFLGALYLSLSQRPQERRQPGAYLVSFPVRHYFTRRTVAIVLFPPPPPGRNSAAEFITVRRLSVRSCSCTSHRARLICLALPPGASWPVPFLLGRTTSLSSLITPFPHDLLRPLTPLHHFNKTTPGSVASFLAL